MISKADPLADLGQSLNISWTRISVNFDFPQKTPQLWGKRLDEKTKTKVFNVSRALSFLPIICTQKLFKSWITTCPFVLWTKNLKILRLSCPDKLLFWTVIVQQFLTFQRGLQSQPFLCKMESSIVVTFFLFGIGGSLCMQVNCAISDLYFTRSYLQVCEIFCTVYRTLSWHHHLQGFECSFDNLHSMRLNKGARSFPQPFLFTSERFVVVNFAQKDDNILVLPIT